MLDLTAISFELHFAGFSFEAWETVLLVVSCATALVSSVELIRMSSGRERLSQRVAALRGAMTMTARNDVSRHRRPWYDRIGVLIAMTPLVGEAERHRLGEKLAAAGIGGPGRVATFIAVRFLFGIIGASVIWVASAELPPDAEVLGYFLLPLGLVVGWRLPDIVVSRLAARRKFRLEVGFPDALDLLVICADAGLGLEQAMGQVARDLRRSTPEVADEFTMTEAEMQVLGDRRVALEHLAARTGLDTLRGMVSILNQSVKFGTPLSEALRQLSVETRQIRMLRLEERAARLSVTLLLPVMGFIMPCLFLVICGPIALRAYDTFTLFMSTP